MRFGHKSTGRTPSPPTNPPEPKHSHAEHRLTFEWCADIDGYGVEEIEKVDGEPLCVVRAVRGCRRDGCERQEVGKHFFTLEDVPADAQCFCDRENTDVVEECAMNAVIEGWNDEYPQLAIVMGDTLSEPFGASKHSFDRASGECHGRPEEPSHEPHGL
jgi:hypothetical protein